ncbi:MAG: CYTH domain-containing protein [Gemmatimonadota bacterium]
MAREIEVKLRLPDERAAEELIASAGGEVLGVVWQTNYLFDTPELSLRGAGLALRLRDEDGRWSVTLKGPTVRAGAARSREEIEARVDAQAAAAMLAGETSPLAALTGDAPLVASAAGLAPGGIEPLGSFRNRRTRVRALLPGLGTACLELDRTELPGDRTDLEVELELPAESTPEEAAAAEAALARLLAEIGVDAVPSSGKTSRFLAAAGAA